MSTDQLASTETAYADAVTVLAAALDELGARIYATCTWTAATSTCRRAQSWPRR